MERESCALWLHSAPGLGKVARGKLLAYAKGEEEVYHLKEEELTKILPLRQKELFLDWRKRHSPQQLQEALKQRGIGFVPCFAERYPKRLRQLPDMPYALYQRGRLPEEGKWAAAIVGARVCSEYGRKTARWFAAELAAAGVQIISGLARGVDGISQQAAMEAGGTSYGVLGCGVDICYPSENREIFMQCMRNGGILSEYPPGTAPRAGLFPARNRIISGLADAVVVVEARERSGTLITVDMALEQGREVFALPGRAGDALSCGCNILIRQGAAMALSPQDVLEYLSALGGEKKRPAENREAFDPCGKREAAAKQGPCPSGSRQRKMWQLLEDNPQSFGTLHEVFCRQKGMENTTVAETAGLLADLVLDGFAEEKGKSYYYRR